MPTALRYADLLAEARTRVRELMPWDLQTLLEGPAPPLVVDVREPHEFEQLRIAGSLGVPRGVLEAACEWDYDDTVPALAAARGRNDAEQPLVTGDGQPIDADTAEPLLAARVRPEQRRPGPT